MTAVVLCATLRVFCRRVFRRGNRTDSINKFWSICRSVTVSESKGGVFGIQLYSHAKVERLRKKKASKFLHLNALN